MVGSAQDVQALEVRRHALGLSREALGAAAGGVSANTIRRIERGVVRPHRSTVAALIAALDRAVPLNDDDPRAHPRAAGKVDNASVHRPD